MNQIELSYWFLLEKELKYSLVDTNVLHRNYISFNPRRNLRLLK
jgi:hypothetical protein